MFASDQPFIPLFRAAFRNHLRGWRQAAFFWVNANSTPTDSKGYIYVCSAAYFSPNMFDAAEYTSDQLVIPVERIAISGKFLIPFLRTQEEVKDDFIEGMCSAENILPEKVRVEDCLLVIMNITSFLERMDYLDYSYDIMTKKGEKLYSLLERLSILLSFYQIILKSEAMKDETLVPYIQRAKRLCLEKTYGMYDTFDPVVMDLAQSIVSSVESL